MSDACEPASSVGSVQHIRVVPSRWFVAEAEFGNFLNEAGEQPELAALCSGTGNLMLRGTESQRRECYQRATVRPRATT